VATSCEGVAPDYCTLRWATQVSYNVPFFHYVERSGQMGGTGAAGVVKAARDAGITMMTDTEHGNPHDLTNITDGTELARDPFDNHVAFGQYPVTVLDHANGVATLAAGGLYHKAHFVERVEQRDPATDEWQVIRSAKIEGEQRVEKPIADAITGVLATIPGLNGKSLANNRPAAAKTGTWEHPNGGNRDAWVVGYTPQIAVAVWVGDPKNERIRYTWGEDISSGNLPSFIWKDFMDKAHDVKEWEILQFPPAPEIGNVQHQYANGVMPQPPEPDEEEECRNPFGCGGRNNDRDRGDDQPQQPQQPQQPDPPQQPEQPGDTTPVLPGLPGD
jgi:Membrane carboxypeptidase (penicillin-binding protein)